MVDLQKLPELYRNHIARLSTTYAEVLKKHALDSIVLHTGSPKQKSIFDDQYWPLVVVPHTKHWLPLSVADSAVVITAGKKPQLFLNTALDFWEGKTPLESDHFWTSFDVVDVKGADAIKEFLPRGKRAFIG